MSRLASYRGFQVACPISVQTCHAHIDERVHIVPLHGIAIGNTHTNEHTVTIILSLDFHVHLSVFGLDLRQAT